MKRFIQVLAVVLLTGLSAQPAGAVEKDYTVTATVDEFTRVVISGGDIFKCDPEFTTDPVTGEKVFTKCSNKTFTDPNFKKGKITKTIGLGKLMPQIVENKDGDFNVWAALSEFFGQVYVGVISNVRRGNSAIAEIRTLAGSTIKSPSMASEGGAAGEDSCIVAVAKFVDIGEKGSPVIVDETHQGPKGETLGQYLKLTGLGRAKFSEGKTLAQVLRGGTYGVTVGVVGRKEDTTKPTSPDKDVKLTAILPAAKDYQGTVRIIAVPAS